MKPLPSLSGLSIAPPCSTHASEWVRAELFIRQQQAANASRWLTMTDSERLEAAALLRAKDGGA